MASLLSRSLQPGSGVGLTSGTEYFKKLGRDAKGGVNKAVADIKKVDSAPPPGVGMNINPASSESGFSQPVSSGGTPGAQPIGLTSDQALALQLGSKAAGLVGMATGNQELGKMAQMGGTVGAIDQAGKGKLGPIGATIGGYTAGPAGAVLGNVIGNAMGDRPVGPTGQKAPLFSDEQIVNAGAGAAGLGLPNLGLQLATGLFGDTPTSFGDIAVNAPIGQAALGNYGPVDNAQAGMAINRSSDPLGAFMAARGENVSMNPEAARAGAQAVSWGTNVPMADAAQMINTGAGSSGEGTTIDVPAPTPAASTDAFDDFSTGGVFSTSSDSGSSGGDSAGDTGGGYGGYSASDSYGSFDGGAGMANGGLVNMPGLTKRYADGGDVMGGMGAPQMQMGNRPDPQQMQAQVAQMLRDPQSVQRIMARPIQLMQSGELTPDEVVTMGRVAEAAMYNPSLYPQLRQFVEAQGMTPLPPSFDPSVILKIIVIARGLQMMSGGGAGQATPPGQVPSMGQAQMENPVGMRNGGYLRGPGTGRSDSIGTINETTGTPVKVANGEYVIPEHVVRAKGRDFFDGLLRKYTQVPKS